MGFINFAFLKNKLAWIYFVAGMLLEYLALGTHTKQEAFVGVFISAFMAEVIRFLKNRSTFIDDEHRKMYLMKAVGNWFAALFGAIFVVLILWVF